MRLDGGQWDMLAQYVIGHRPSGKRQSKKLVAIHNGIREVLNRHEYWFAVPDIRINLKTETLELIITVLEERGSQSAKGLLERIKDGANIDDRIDLQLP